MHWWDLDGLHQRFEIYIKRLYPSEGKGVIAGRDVTQPFLVDGTWNREDISIAGGRMAFPLSPNHLIEATSRLFVVPKDDREPNRPNQRWLWLQSTANAPSSGTSTARSCRAAANRSGETAGAVIRPSVRRQCERIARISSWIDVDGCRLDLSEWYWSSYGAIPSSLPHTACLPQSVGLISRQSFLMLSTIHFRGVKC